MYSPWCPSKEIDKKSGKGAFLIVQQKNNDILPGIKEERVQNIPKVVSSKGKISRPQIFGLDLRSTSNRGVRIETPKRYHRLNINKTKDKNNQFLSWLQPGYILPQPSSVGSFIQEHKELVSLLTEAFKELRKYFPTEDFKLQLVSDPEIAGEQQLFVYISTSLSVTDALKKLDKFDEKWWLDRIDRANGLLNFNLRFV
jgi:hypothetical protein